MEKRKKILNFSIVSLFILINAIAILILINYSQELYYKLSGILFSPLKEHVEFLCIRDLDANGSDDVISIYSDEPYPYKKVLSVFNFFNFNSFLKLDYFFEILVSSDENLCLPEDLNSDGQVEISVIKILPKEIILNIFSPNGNLMRTLHFPNHLPEKSYFNQVRFEDLDGDGVREMIGLFGTAWWAKPRGAVAFRLNPPELLWLYLIAADPLSLEIEDVNNDGKKEIFIGSFAPHNGVAVNDTDDDHSYLIALDSGGKRIWQQEVGWYYTRIYFTLEDLDRDGRKEIICSKSCHREYAFEPGEIKIIDPLTGEVKKTLRARDFSYTDVHVIKEKKGWPQIVIGTSTGKVFVYDQQLREVRNASFEAPTRVLRIGPLGLDLNQNYVFIQSGFTKFLILKDNLHLVNKTTFNPFSRLEHTAFYLAGKGGKETAGLLNADKLYMVKKVRMNFLVLLKSFLLSPASLALCLFFFTNFLFFGVVVKRKLSLYKPLAEIGEWEETSQEIIHQLRNLMFTIQLEAENGARAVKTGSTEDNPQEVAASWQSILDDVKRASHLLRAFSKISIGRPLKLEIIDLNQLILSLVRRLAEPLKDRIEFITAMEKEKIFIKLDKEKIEEALTNIILNSVEALPDKGWVKISTNIDYSPFFSRKRGVWIEIEDNGIGIPSDKINEIFKPSFSTKREGLGIGLTVSKKIIDAHGGKIYVYSKEKVGTRFAIYLPWPQKIS